MRLPLYVVEYNMKVSISLLSYSICGKKSICNLVSLPTINWTVFSNQFIGSSLQMMQMLSRPMNVKINFFWIVLPNGVHGQKWSSEWINVWHLGSRNFLPVLSNTNLCCLLIMKLSPQLNMVIPSNTLVAISTLKWKMRSIKRSSNPSSQIYELISMPFQSCLKTNYFSTSSTSFQNYLCTLQLQLYLKLG